MKNTDLKLVGMKIMKNIIPKYHTIPIANTQIWSWSRKGTIFPQKQNPIPQISHLHTLFLPLMKPKHIKSHSPFHYHPKKLIIINIYNIVIIQRRRILYQLVTTHHHSPPRIFYLHQTQPPPSTPSLKAAHWRHIHRQKASAFRELLSTVHHHLEKLQVCQKHE